MVYITLIHTETPACEDLINGWAVDSDHDYASSRDTEPGRQRTLLGRAALRALVSRVTGSDGKTWTLINLPGGKPQLNAPTGEEPLHASISHSGKLVACAVTRRGPLGIDVELHKPGRRFAALAERSFGEAEQTAVARDGAPGFYRIWTLREAMAKALGSGLVTATDRRDRFPDFPPGAAKTMMIDGQTWLFAHFDSASVYSLAAAVLSQSGAAWSKMPLQWVDLDVQSQAVIKRI
jgi:4'-phosphopantetheinyl transferase